ncbi:MAG: heptaprenyl diphosphate synthase [Chloroflexi bacterium]|nr:heptaprenyl diphosphate synthase [Chloroflexota bacterium]
MIEKDSTPFYYPILSELNEVNSLLKHVTSANFPFLASMLDHIIDSGGKRIRPSVTLLASKLNNHDNSTPIIMATAIEMLHIATLIHDDTVDDSKVRRGKATISNLWGQKAAVLAGDYIFAASATQVCATKNIRVIRRFSETIMELSLGELQEMEINFNPQTNLSNYLERIYNKTASLFSTSAQSGAILSGCDEESIKSLQSYGYNIGMAFQIIDDILDFQGNEVEVGKPIQTDLANGILTLPSIYALESDFSDKYISIFDQSNTSVEVMSEFVELVENSKSLERSFATATEYSGKAKMDLEKFPDSDAKEALEFLADYIIMRKM